MLAALAQRPKSTYVVQPTPVTVPHIAIGIWVGLAFVLLCPDTKKRPKGQRNDSTADLVTAYSIAMAPFSLL